MERTRATATADKGPQSYILPHQTSPPDVSDRYLMCDLFLTLELNGRTNSSSRLLALTQSCLVFSHTNRTCPTRVLQHDMQVLLLVVQTTLLCGRTRHSLSWAATWPMGLTCRDQPMTTPVPARCSQRSPIGPAYLLVKIKKTAYCMVTWTHIVTLHTQKVVGPKKRPRPAQPWMRVSVCGG